MCSAGSSPGSASASDTSRGARRLYPLPARRYDTPVMSRTNPTPDIIGRLVAARPLKELARSLAAARAATASGLWGSSVAAVVAAVEKALKQSVPSRQQLDLLIRMLKPGQDLEPEKLIVWLTEHGYNRLDQVEVPGDFAVRGGIIDVYLPGEHEASGDQIGLTARIDFFGDQIESIKRFDLDTLGSLEVLPSVRIIDIKGTLPDVGESVSMLSFMPEDAIVVLWAPLEIAEQARSYLDRLPEVKNVYPLNAVLRLAQQYTLLELSQFDQSAATMPSLVGEQEVKHVHLPIQSVQKFETEAKKALRELAELAETHKVTVFCENEGEQKRFAELLDQDQPGLREKIEIPM